MKNGDSTKLRLKYTGLSYFKKQNLEHSVNCLSKAYKKDTADLQIIFFLGSALGKIGKADEGLNYLFKSLEMIEPDKENLKSINSEIAKIYSIKNKPKKSVSSFEHPFCESYKFTFN